MITIVTSELTNLPPPDDKKEWVCQILVDDMAISVVIPESVKEKDLQKYLDDREEKYLEQAVMIYGTQMSKFDMFREIKRLKKDVDKLKGNSDA